MKFYITQEAKDKMFMYAEKCDIEISGLGNVDIVDGDLIVKDVFILEQKCTSGTTDIDEEALADMYLKMAKEGQTNFNVKLWWHSHVNMGTFWSTTDDETVERFSGTADWFLSIVINKKGEYKARLDLYTPVRVTKDDIDMVIISEENAELEKQIEEEIEEKVKKSYTTYGNYYGGRGHDYGGYGWYDRDYPPHDSKKQDDGGDDLSEFLNDQDDDDDEIEDDLSNEERSRLVNVWINDNSAEGEQFDEWLLRKGHVKLKKQAS